jgi:hypothetical protein
MAEYSDLWWRLLKELDSLAENERQEALRELQTRFGSLFGKLDEVRKLQAELDAMEAKLASAEEHIRRREEYSRELEDEVERHRQEHPGQDEGELQEQLERLRARYPNLVEELERKLTQEFKEREVRAGMEPVEEKRPERDDDEEAGMPRDVSDPQKN